VRADCHVHVVGPIGRYPQAASRSYTAGPASAEHLLAAAATRGVDRFVLVQPSFYGLDNSMLLDTLSLLGTAARGVAVVDPLTVTPEELARFEEAGVCGIRVNLYSESALRASAERPLQVVLADAVALAAELGWHVEVIARAAVLNEAAELIARSPVTIVVDHYGLFGDDVPGSPEGRRLIGVLGFEHVWTKLSGPYRNAVDPFATRPDAAWLEAILGAASERCVWGSDWPHTPTSDEQRGTDVVAPYRPVSYGALFDDFDAAVGDESLLAQLLGANALQLYGLPRS